jgi:hypothetical protein
MRLSRFARDGLLAAVVCITVLSSALGVVGGKVLTTDPNPCCTVVWTGG